jgi:hypothetical protein
LNRISRHGVVIPPFPKDLLRDLAQQFSSKPLSKDALPLLEKAADEFFRNIRLFPLFLANLVRIWLLFHVMLEGNLLKKGIYRCSSNGTSDNRQEY